MKKRFILLIDLTETSKNILRFAYNWAKKVDAELLVINQVLSVAPGIGETEIRNEIKRRERKNALVSLKSFVGNLINVPYPVKYFVTTGSLETAIHKLHRSEMMDLIVLGMKSKNWLERIFLQSTAVRLYHEVNKMILALPVDFRSEGFSSLHVAVTPENPLNEDILRKLFSLTASITEKAYLFSIMKPDETEERVHTYLESLKELYAGQLSLNTEIIRADNVYTGIKEYMIGRPGILVMQKATRSLYDFFKKDLIHNLLHSSDTPMVILP